MAGQPEPFAESPCNFFFFDSTFPIVVILRTTDFELLNHSGCLCNSGCNCGLWCILYSCLLYNLCMLQLNQFSYSTSSFCISSVLVIALSCLVCYY